MDGIFVPIVLFCVIGISIHGGYRLFDIVEDRQGPGSSQDMTLPQPALGSLPGTPSDEGWVAASLNGSGLARKAAYSNLVRRHEGPVRNLLRHLCRSHAIADELAQDAFLTGWLKLTTLRNPQTFGAWIQQIAYREFLHSARTLRLEHKSTPETVGELQVEATNPD